MKPHADNVGSQELAGSSVDRIDVHLDSKDHLGLEIALVDRKVRARGGGQAFKHRTEVHMNSKDRNGQTPLSCVAKIGCEVVVRHLVDWTEGS
jgi:hypothetical protein